MTPLEQAQRQKKYGCDTCGKRVVVRGVSYCEVSGKLLLPSLLDVGQCMHVPSEGEPKGDGMETRENELHEPIIKKKLSVSGDLQVTTLCSVCGNVIARSGWYDSSCEDILLREAKEKAKNYCQQCGARLKEI